MKATIKITDGKNITARRKILHISKYELAKRLNISWNHMDGVEKGKRNASIKLKEKIECVFKRLTYEKTIRE